MKHIEKIYNLPFPESNLKQNKFRNNFFFENELCLMVLLKFLHLFPL